MELLYVWIDNFQEGLIEEQGFNFDNRFKYHLKYNESNGKFELGIKPNHNYLEDFFQPENHNLEQLATIKNITAIVGQNGAGKSSIVDFLKDNFGADSLREYEDGSERYLYILREYKNSRMEHYICFSKEMKIDIKVDNETSYFYEIRIGSGLPRNLKDTTLIYFSNVFDNKEEYSNESMVNISTNHLASNFYNFESDYIEGEGPSFKFQEVKRQIRFIQAVKSELKKFELPFNVPNQIDLIFTGIESTRRSRNSEEKDIMDCIRNLGLDIRRKRFQLPVEEEEQKIIIGFIKCILNHLVRELSDRKFRRIIDFPFRLFQDESNESNKNDFIRLVRGVRRFSRVIRKRNEGGNELADMLKGLTIFMMMFYRSYRYRVEIIKRPKYKLSFTLEELNGGELEEFIDLYEKSYLNHEFINFSWRSLSSGQQALINIYSRFYFVSNRWELTENPTSDLIIFIDEGEVYLHPHWQGKLLNSLIEYFPVVFGNRNEGEQRNIQLILTSNSPFMLSDLPGTNIIFLKKEEEKTVVIGGLEEYNQTFAANIHSLLAHSFFMEDGVTGAFAKRKINEIVHLLVKGDINRILQNEQKIERTINLIGEPVIRNKLSQMLRNRLSTRMINVNNEIEHLKSRLEELEMWKNDTNKTR
ncbi:AAA family ATPase [Bacillus cereus group sp. Bce002]|uniref:AAA family ATPase n=1 Tax=Bacillus cereus group sp. Bce002 TaxID=3445259 RepID=UPI003F29DDAE